MANWVLKGLRTGIRTTAYPQQHDNAAGVSPGRPLGGFLSAAEKAESLAARCPTQAITRRDGRVAIDHGRCIHCFRCHRDTDDATVAWESGYEWATYSQESVTATRKLETVFGRSLHIRFVDAAAGGVAEIIPVDIVVPGCPPPPLAILHALLLVVERKPPSALVSPAPEPV